MEELISKINTVVARDIFYITGGYFSIVAIFLSSGVSIEGAIALIKEVSELNSLMVLIVCVVFTTVAYFSGFCIREIFRFFGIVALSVNPIYEWWLPRRFHQLAARFGPKPEKQKSRETKVEIDEAVYRLLLESPSDFSLTRYVRMILAKEAFATIGANFLFSCGLLFPLTIQYNGSARFWFSISYPDYFWLITAFLILSIVSCSLSHFYTLRQRVIGESLLSRPVSVPEFN